MESVISLARKTGRSETRRLSARTQKVRMELRIKSYDQIAFRELECDRLS